MEAYYVWIGVAVLLLTVWALIKGYEARLVLIVSGFVMACIAMDPMAAFNGMSKGMTAKTMILNICSVMGFAFTMRYTKCDIHLGQALAKPLGRMQLFLVPGAALCTFLVNIALPSCSGTSAAVGSVVIPLLMSLGVHPAMAAGACMMGTFGEMLSPGMLHNVYVAEIATKWNTAHGGAAVDVMDVIARNSTATFICLGVTMVILWGMGIALKEYKGYVMENKEASDNKEFKVNYLYAIMPLVPITMLVVGGIYKQELPFLGGLKVPHCMLIGAMLALLVTRANPKNFSKEFFNGMGKGYADIMGIIIGAYIMLGGMGALGLIKAAENLMKSSPDLASILAVVGPFGLAMMTGSGNSATMIFNGAISINAPDFGMSVIDMGTLATIAGCLGRACSPLAGGAIICAGFAGLDGAMQMTKRTFIPCIIVSAVAYFALMYL